MKDAIIKIAKAVSWMFSPMLMPTYGMILSLFATYLLYANISLSTRLTVIGAVFAATAMIPAIVIYILHRIGIVKDARLNERTDRFLPLGAAIVCYCGITVYLMQIHSPQWMLCFMLGAAGAVITMLLISLKWKISGHATGVGGLCVFVFSLYYRHYAITGNLWLLYATFIAAGLVCTSRLMLQRHSPAQVAAGFLNGALWLTLFEIIFI